MLFAEGLARSYVFDSRRIEVLRGLDLAVRAGELAGVVGASGTGKSTLLHILGGLDRPDAGRVTVAGEDLFAMDDDRRSGMRGGNIGFVFQFHHLLPEFTALENVLMPAMIARHDPRLAREKAEGLFGAVGLSERMAHRPGKLSGGEQQRVAIIRALMNDPKALLADEPTGNLDETTAEEVFGLLKNMVKERGIAAVIVTHNMRLAAMMDTVYELHGGSLHGRA
ncbi:MAG: ABC transporter ATP-binding protein [Nitrospinae bacterium]|nr:ABC transporter ATP-binding protein [Nitrospinota bacterium]